MKKLSHSAACICQSSTSGSSSALRLAKMKSPTARLVARRPSSRETNSSRKSKRDKSDRSKSALRPRPSSPRSTKKRSNLLRSGNRIRTVAHRMMTTEMKKTRMVVPVLLILADRRDLKCLCLTKKSS